MKKQKNKKVTGKINWKKRILITLGCVLGSLVLVVAAIYLWPLRDPSLQSAETKSLSFEAAKQNTASLQQKESAAGVTPECQSRLLVHEQKTEKSVIMYHGVGGCSLQFSDLAQYFYDRGYNVYAPTAPQHGTSNDTAYSKVTSKQLVDFANQSANIGSAIGKSTGVIGMSGGGMLASWTSQYHANMKHLLVLSPFFEPSRQQAAAYKIKPFILFYGKHILPDAYSVSEDGGRGLSYYALTQFVMLGKNLPQPAVKTDLQSVGIVMAEDDELINQPLAKQVIGNIAQANNLDLSSYNIPASWSIGHVTVGPENDSINPYRDELYQKYFDMYSGN